MSIQAVASGLLRVCTFVLVCGTSVSSNAQQQQQPQPAKPAPVAKKPLAFEQLRSKINDNTVAIISGNPNGGYLGIAYDISAAIDDGDNLRVLPIVGKGAVQNVKDVLFLKGVDMGLANTVTLSHFREDKELGRYVSRQMVYITRLFEDELHILVRPDIKTFKDLEGKRINFSDAGSGAQLAAQRMFAAYGMKVTEVNMGQADAIEKMKAGEVDATLCTCLKPLRPYQQVPAALGFRLLEVPFEGPMEQDYVPATFQHEDYPNLIAKGQTVSTVAVPTALIAYNWSADHERYRRLTKFVEAFFTKFGDLHKPPRHPRWRTVNLAASMKDWTRFAPAQAWIDKNVGPARAASVITAPEPVPVSGDAEQQRLYREFLEWRRKRGTQ